MLLAQNEWKTLTVFEYLNALHKNYHKPPFHLGQLNYVYSIGMHNRCFPVLWCRGALSQTQIFQGIIISSLWQKWKENKKFHENKENLILTKYDIPCDRFDICCRFFFKPSGASCEGITKGKQSSALPVYYSIIPLT